jgi:hypothetical protein
MPRRIILHAGFHKTGTSTVQQTLRQNRVRLKSQAALRLRWHMQDLILACRGYSTWRDPLTLIKVQHRFHKLLEELPGMPRRSLIISAEELVGHLPGRGDLDDYSAAPELLYALWEIAAERFPKAEILIYLTTRGRDTWLASAWAEHVKSSSMTLGFDEFASRYRHAGDLPAMVTEVASRVPCPVHQAALEDCLRMPLGPTTPLLRLCELPVEVEVGLEPVPPHNARPDPALLQALLEANRKFTDPEARRAAKSEILAKAPAR